MIKRYPNVSLQLPEFAQTEGFVITIHKRTELAFQVASGQVHQSSMQQVLDPLLTDGLIKIIILDKHRTGL